MRNLIFPRILSKKSLQLMMQFPIYENLARSSCSKVKFYELILLMTCSDRDCLFLNISIKLVEVINSKFVRAKTTCYPLQSLTTIDMKAFNFYWPMVGLRFRVSCCRGNSSQVFVCDCLARSFRNSICKKHHWENAFLAYSTLFISHWTKIFSKPKNHIFYLIYLCVRTH